MGAVTGRLCLNVCLRVCRKEQGFMEFLKEPAETLRAEDWLDPATIRACRTMHTRAKSSIPSCSRLSR
eukprot:3413862-Rhodomonas_salina.2